MSKPHSLSEVHRDLLTDQGMARAREVVCRNHQWFVHASPIRCFERIRKNGLQPRNPFLDGDDGSDLTHATARVVCLTPIPSGMDTRPKRGEAQFVVAVQNVNLPANVGVDRSYTGFAELIDILKNERPDRDNADIFAEVVYRRGCIISFDAVPPENLRLWDGKSPIDVPAGWPQLTACSVGDAGIVE